jgi:hypothetical protein
MENVGIYVFYGHGIFFGHLVYFVLIYVLYFSHFGTFVPWKIWQPWCWQEIERDILEEEDISKILRFLRNLGFS